MQVDILYVDDCPNYTRACAVVCEVIAEQDLDATIKITKVTPENLTDYSQFRGSPTVLVDGIDAEDCYHQATTGQLLFDIISNEIACRLYNCDVHRGCPSSEMIRCVIEKVHV